MFSVDTTHNVGLFIDGVHYQPYGWTQVTSGSQRWGFDVPNDGLEHKIQLLDDGTRGTPATKSQILTAPDTDCAGILTFEALGEATHPVTKEKYVKVRVTNTGAVNETLITELYIDPIGTGATYLRPGEEKVLTHKVPADGKVHLVEGRGWRPMPNGSNAYHGGLLHWGIKGNPTPPVPEDPAASATVFTPGEMVYVRSSSTSTPLKTDGSEWVLLEIRKRPGLAEVPEPWRLVGTEGGYVLPQQDGSWVSSIQTDATSYPLGSKWDLRARRFQEYRPSEEYLQYFNMGNSGGGEPPQASVPFILGPGSPFPDGIMRLNTWVTLYGNGTPGSVIEFQTTTQDSGITPNTPAPCTVGADGRWQTRVYEYERGPGDEVWVITYRARAKLNDQVTEWSGPLQLWWSDN
ncbi:hypothetical protein AB0G06_43650 [Nonomuraea dietziae]|uniref:hypothetical protein n=1 Tax=Nonomuraea dietziae TaxID=65515 RepID=UPI0033E68F77